MLIFFEYLVQKDTTWPIIKAKRKTRDPEINQIVNFSSFSLVRSLRVKDRSHLTKGAALFFCFLFFPFLIKNHMGFTFQKLKIKKKINEFGFHFATTHKSIDV